MINVKKEGVLLKKTHLDFENEGVLNPAVIANETGIHLFYRAVAKGNYSSIGYCKLSSPLVVEDRLQKPLLYREHSFESHGMEDPRITKIEELYYLTYTAYDGENALGALATSGDLLHFDKKGIIAPKIGFTEFSRLVLSMAGIGQSYIHYNRQMGVAKQAENSMYVWNKNLVFFPTRINGQLYILLRIRPAIQLIAVNSLEDLTIEFWHNYFLRFSESLLLAPKYKHEMSYIGAGCPPIETSDGWLLVYHGVHDTNEGHIYSACVALLDLHNPQKEVARLPYPLFKPEYDWEVNGKVSNVCFPTGAVVSADTLFIYYGAADEQIACASVSISALLEELKLTKNDEEK